MTMERLLDRWRNMLRAEEDTQRKLSRRQFLIETGRWTMAAFGLTLAGYAAKLGFPIEDGPLRGDPFALGVASGDPLPHGVVLWTRLAPDPNDGGGMGDKSVPVAWEVASDERFTKPVRQGVAFARPELGHSVHVEVNGLEPNRIYYYRFRAGKAESPTGRTKTLPAYGSSVEELSFAFASCQNYEDGYYTAYRHMRGEPLDFVLHLGDYIYESGFHLFRVRPHAGGRTISLEDYRNRYAQYRSDADLRDAHAAFPWFVTMDDHEVENNWAGSIPQRDQPIEPFLHRRLAAFQAFYEHMPLRPSSMPRDGGMRLYRRFAYGDLASFHLLDTRQYRDDQANGDGWKAPNARSAAAGRTLLGGEQEAWLRDGLSSSGAVWNVLAQQVFFSKRDGNLSDAGERLSMDAWDGYPAARSRLLDFVQDRGVRNLVVLTGDVHSNWANEIKADFDDPRSRSIGVEWVGTSISSSGDGAERTPDTDALLDANPHLKFYNGQRGYVACRVTREQWRTDYRVLPFVSRPGAPIRTRASFVVRSGNPTLRRADADVPQ